MDLASNHAVWSIPLEYLDMLTAAFGSDWEVVDVSVLDQARGGEVPTTTENAYEGAEVYFGWGVPRKVIAAAGPTLRWAHSAAAGVGASVTPEFCASGAILTNSRGIHSEPVSDWVVAAIGFCIRGFHSAVAAQRAHSWDRRSFTSVEFTPAEFSSLRVGVVGLGGIGSAIARKCDALGMEVRAVRRHATSRLPAGVSSVSGPEGLLEVASQSDVLVLALPLSGATAGIIGDDVLRALPRGAFLLNVSRGGVLDEDSLLEHLNTGQIRGCALDVFAQEPLDSGHPFWDDPRVFVTPHVGAVSDRFWEREIDLIVDNVGRFLAGDRLRNVVNLEAGY